VSDSEWEFPVATITLAIDTGEYNILATAKAKVTLGMDHFIQDVSYDGIITTAKPTTLRLLRLTMEAENPLDTFRALVVKNKPNPAPVREGPGLRS